MKGAPMTDLEMTKLCAEAMDLEICNYSSDTGVQVANAPQGVLGLPPAPRNAYSWFKYDPLHDDAQAMALVKKFHLMVNWNSPIEVWCMPMDQAKYGHLADSPNCSDLNRAICECVSKMESAHDQN